jgi:hypothetical protein
MSTNLLGMVECFPLHARVTPVGCRGRQALAETVARGIVAGALQWDGSELGCLSACGSCPRYEGDRECVARARTRMEAEYRELCRMMDSPIWDVSWPGDDGADGEEDRKRLTTRLWVAANRDRKRELDRRWRERNKRRVA